MPFGTFSAAHRLGIGNCTQRNPTAFAQTVLRLAAGAPVYQQQLVHDATNRMGPEACAEWCGNPDAEIGRSNILRQVSAHDFIFARRNISDSPFYRYNTYIHQYNNQTFFLSNEPETSSPLSSQGVAGRCGTCWEAPEWVIDSALAGCFPDPETQFWQSGMVGFQLGCGTQDWKRIRATAMARVYRYVKALGESAGRGHAIIPPPSIGAALGLSGDERAVYWTAFYDAAMWGVPASGACGAYGGQSVSQLGALHTHAYTNYNKDKPSIDPIESAARLAIYMRMGADWFRNRYNGGAALPCDYIVSETGPDWRIYDQFKDTSLSWTGGFNTMVQGLSFWNSYLAWLTRRAPLELNLQGWETGARTAFACIHAPANAPYVTAEGANSTRNQRYMNLDAWNTYVYYSAPVIETGRPGATGLYQSSFTAFQPTSYNGASWRLGPFGACYAVWSQVANDPNTSTLGAGWVYDGGQAGSRGRVTVNVRAGWSTIYIPFMKNYGATAGVQYHVIWHRGDGVLNNNHGYMDFGSWEDARTASADGYAQPVYSAMVLPLIVYSGVARSFQLELSRNIGGTGIFVGRPIVLCNVACSWSVYS